MPLVTRGSIVFLLGLALFGVLVACGFVWSGWYGIGADDAHTPPVRAALQALRDHSLDAHARGLRLPDLASDALVRQGAGNYAAMCSGCHLSPGGSPTELSRGLYPAPPVFAALPPGPPARQFWATKHGIKASGMPAWGRSMDDRYVWGLVAFLQRLPSLDAARYEALVASSGGHSHGGGESHPSHAEETAHAEGEEAHAHVHDHHDGMADHDHASAASGADAGGAEAAAVVDRFGQAIAHGDLKAAEDLLAPDVLVLESGGAERTRAEYMAHHAGADAAFLRGATVHPGPRTVRVEGNMAYVASQAEIHARRGEQPLTLQSTETMVLQRHDGAWKIVHIHWSSAKE